MKLNVFLHGKRVAVLESADGFKHTLSYVPDIDPEQFVSLLMPVQTASWDWPALHPFFQVNLPEGFLLSVLKETLGPLLGASPLELLAVVGRNTVGRVQVAAGDSVELPPNSFDVKHLLHGERSEEAFMSLVREYAASGVSGVIPKFLSPETTSLFRKASVTTERYIVKGSSARFPFVALNEHLCMQVARKTGYPTPHTAVSDDGQTLVVERFDIEEASGERLGFEDFCSLLGLAPEDKYQSTWERVARLAREWVSPEHLRTAQEQLATTLLLTYALGNADCHTKNLALVYRSSREVRLAPIYDMVSILVYDGYASNPPGMFVGGRKSWNPGKVLWSALQQHLGIEPAHSHRLVDAVCSATSSVVPELVQHIRHTPGFAQIGARMLQEWNAGMKRLAPRCTVDVPDFEKIAQEHNLPAPTPPAPHVRKRVGESQLLAKRGRRKRHAAS